MCAELGFAQTEIDRLRESGVLVGNFAAQMIANVMDSVSKAAAAQPDAPAQASTSTNS